MVFEEDWRPKRLVVASTNRHKVAEIEVGLRQSTGSLDIRGLPAFGDPPTIEETAPDFAGNARLKAEGMARWLRGQGEPGDTVVLADDSGVCVDVLDGAPGVRSARFAGEAADDAANNAKLVAELRARGVERSAGHYRCVLALTRVDGAQWGDLAATSRLFEGRWDIELRVQRQGSGGFGYDPHAWLADGRTVAELDPMLKASVSHRGQALRALLRWQVAR